jgi:hypothetical protein
MHIRKRTAWLAVIALCGGALAGAGQASAMASPADGPVSIAAQSSIAPVSGDVFVAYLGGTYSQATISGTVTSVSTSGEVVELFAQPFPYKTAATSIDSSTLSQTTGSDPYQFTVTPTLATRYTAELFASASSTTPLATSSTVTVYDAHNYYANGFRRCGRPVCHQNIKFHIAVPPSTLRTEMAKKIYTYFGLKLNPRREPGLPKELIRGAGHAVVSHLHKVNGHEYEFTVSLSFRIGNDGWHFAVMYCQKDTESKDGLNLPGKHGCGNRTLGITKVYIGTSNVSQAGLAAVGRAVQ